MANNLAFVILLPNARRENVKVSLDTSILQVLEDACKKRGLNANEWNLKHLDQIVELGNPVRFSGLPNNATLELVQSAKPRVESPITVVLQLESGKRLTEQFAPRTTLWEILEYWTSHSRDFIKETRGIDLAWIYMRQEIHGKKQLQEKTLKSLGLFQGSAVIRLIHRPTNQVSQQANIPGIHSKRTPPNVTNISGNAATRIPPANTTNSKDEHIKSLNEASPRGVNKNKIASSHLNQTLNKVNATKSQSQVPQRIPPYSNGKSPKSATNIDNSVRRQRHAKPGEFHILGPNNALLYHADDVDVPEIESLPDEFYSVTVQDVRTMYKSLHERRIQLENAPLQTRSARNLEHDNNIQRMLTKHPTTIVRIRFPDRFVLQAIFKTNDTIGVVYKFLRNYLEDSRLNFYLFKTPPCQVLAETTTLVEQNLVGLAVIYFGSNTQRVHYLKGSLQPSDPQRVFTNVSSNTGKTEKSSRGRRSTAPLPTPGNNAVLASGQNATRESYKSEDENRAGTSSGKGSHNTGRAPAGANNIVPKWFKK